MNAGSTGSSTEKPSLSDTTTAAGDATATKDTIATEEVTKRCNNCGNADDALLRCGRCKVTWYCSKNCQANDWKYHKKPCKAYQNGGPLPTSTNSVSKKDKKPAPKGLSQHIDKPFTRLENKTFLHDLPETDVYRLLIDSFRMRQEDEYKFSGDADVDSIYDGSANSLRPFKNFLSLAEKVFGILPPWWNATKRRACIDLSMKGGDEWADISRCVEKHDIVEHYGDPQMPMKLRMMAEYVCGIASWAQGGGGTLRKILMQSENGSGT